MDLNDIRKQIDGIDLEIRQLLMRRMDCSYQVAQAKQEAGSTDIYRPDREQSMLYNLGQDVPEDRRDQYLAVVRKITQASREYQYGLICQWNDSLFKTVAGSQLVDRATSAIDVCLACNDQPGALAALLGTIGDYGFNISALAPAEDDKAASAGTAAFDLTIQGDAAAPRMHQLLFQLSKEAADFRISAVR